MNEPNLSAFIWSVADLLQGDYKQSDYGKVILNAIIDALDAHNTMSTQALNSEQVRAGIKDVLLNYANLWESLREKAGSTPR